MTSYRSSSGIVLFTLICLLVAGIFHSAKGQTFSQISCREIAIIGAVKTPGRLNVQGPVRLSEVLTQAGGPTAGAGKIVRVHHFCNCGPCSEAQTKTHKAIEYDLPAVLQGKESANPYVEAGDFVSVPETNIVFVIGNFLRRRLTYEEGMTLTRAISLAGSVITSSDLTRVRIHRTVAPGLATEKSVFNLKAIVEGQVEDPLLRPLDILEISDEQGQFLSPSGLRPPIYLDPPLLPRNSPNC